MADGVIQFVLRNLNSLIQSELGLLFGVDEEMKKLSSALSAIQAVLDDAEQRKHKDKALQDWLRKLKDAAYEIDDVLDDCATQARQREYQTQNSSTLKKVSTSLLTGYPVEIIRFRHQIGNRMKKITKMLDAIGKERDKFHLRVGVLEDRASFAKIRETSSVPSQTPLLGREEEKEKIVKMLVEDVRDFEKVSVYPIVGMGGLGKTTLAQMVFNDDRVKLHFEPKIWVYVSQDLDVKKVLETIIESVSRDSCKVSNLDSLWKKVRESLDGKRYLLVLDDVWVWDEESQKKFEELMSGLACGAKGASVVITTRLVVITTSLNMVKSVVTTLEPLLLPLLSTKDCWLLFSQRAFAHENDKRPNLVAIGKEIVKKCGGVPLAAKALGGLMRFKSEEKEWHSIKDSQIWKLTQNESSVMPALQLSYYDLPLELRRCFAYCAVFLKGSEIEKESLIHHWMANGFISPDGNLEVEDVGNVIWKELCLRSFFQDVEERQSGVTTFRMHDLIHDLAQSIMEDECDVMEAKSSSIVSNQKIRYVTLVVNNGNCFIFPKALHKVESVRTIQRQLRKPYDIYGNFRTEFTCDFTNFGSLRVFDGRGPGMLQLSNSIGNSKHLRYLNLSRALIQTLPKSICSLYNLQTLNLNYCRELQKLPENMKDLRSLRHLYLEGCYGIRHMPPKLGQLTNLKTLSFFLVGKRRGCGLAELKDLDLGGVLRIRCLDEVSNLTDAQQSNLVKKQSLRFLELSWSSKRWQTESKANVEQLIEALEPHPNIEELVIENYRGSRFPHWMRYSILQNIAEIRLDNCINCLELLAFGQLPSLRSLRIERMDYVEYIDNDFPDGGPVRGFPSLEELRISQMRNLKGLSREDGIDLLPRLREISIAKCPKLILPHLSSPEKLEVWHCGNVLESSISNFDGLTSLSVYWIEDMISFPEDTSQNLSTLQSLGIWNCRNLQKLESLASLVSLQSLDIYDCRELESFPESLGNLTSLQSLYIRDCPKIPSIPHSFQNLTKLETFIILGCGPELKRRCQKEIGEDWCKIAHIPYVHVEQE